MLLVLLNMYEMGALRLFSFDGISDNIQFFVSVSEEGFSISRKSPLYFGGIAPL